MNLFYKGSLLLAVSFAFYGSLVLLCGGCSSSSEPLPDKSEIGAAGKTEMMPPLPPEGKKLTIALHHRLRREGEPLAIALHHRLRREKTLWTAVFHLR